MSRLNPTEFLSTVVAGKLCSARVLFLAAHPDDETIGASGVLGRLTEPAVIYLTDGAPRDPKLRSPHVTGSRDLYALVRAEEAASALALAGVPTSGISFLNATDQEAIFDVHRLLEDFVQIAERIAPDFIITHPYEGGHPDHDTAALVAHVAASRLRRGGTTPAVLEFTSYHASAGRRVSGEFLPSKHNPTDSNGIRVVLSAEERARKARMLSCYVSQWHVLSEFPLEPERLRIAPAYDFMQPPHPGLLWYECLHWPMTGAKWRELAYAVVGKREAAA